MSAEGPRVAIVTGANSGVGLETARGLIERGHHVILGVRDPARGEAAARSIGGGEVRRLDLADLASVSAFAAEFERDHARLHLLVNNAGIHTARRTLSPQGFESTFATNHLGHFLLTHLLLGSLRRGAPSRVINVASEAHRFARRVRFDDLAAERGWNGARAYAGSKLANIMFTYALARRLKGTGVTTHAVHPGSVRTNWARGRESGLLRFAARLSTPFLITPEEGARTSLHAATSAEGAASNGLYFVRSKPARSNGPSYDVEAQEALWRASEAACAPYLSAP